MRIGILSDTHNQTDRTRQAVELLLAHDIEAFFHCGDFVDASILSLCAAKPCYFVFGNNDDPTDLHQAAHGTAAVCLEWGGEITLDGKRIALTHGHRFGESSRLLAVQPDFFFSGHSHEVDDHREGPTRHINPGALHRASRYTVAVLDLAADHLQFLEISGKKHRA